MLMRHLGSIMLSNFMPRNQQGLSASLCNTVINYSISIGLGIAGTVESRIIAHGGSTLQGYRGAWYVGIGLGSLGVALSVALLLCAPKEVLSLEGKERGKEGAVCGEGSTTS